MDHKEKTINGCKYWGLKVFKLKGGTKDIPDYPIDNNSWQKNAKIPDGSDTYENIAIVTGSGLFVIDVEVEKDGKPSGFPTLAKFEQEYGKLPYTVEANTRSGGKHLYYLYDNDAYNIRCSQGRMGELKTPGIDIRGDGGYVVAPGSVVTDRMYTWEDLNQGIIEQAPDWLCEILHKEPIMEAVKYTTDDIDDYAWNDITHALSFIDPSLAEDDWWRVCVALFSTGREEAFHAFDSWSSMSPTKYTKEATIKKWNQAAARGNLGINYKYIFKIAKDHGWDGEPPSHEELSRKFFPFLWNGSADKGFQEAMKEVKTIPDPLPYIPFPHFKKLCHDIYDHCVFKYPSFTIHTALAAIGGLAQDKWETPTGIPLNILQIMLAETGAGKEQYADIVQTVLINSLLDNGETPDQAMSFFAKIPSSGPALVNNILERKNKSLFLLEKEGDILFRNKLHVNKNPQAESLITTLLKLYGSKDGTIINGESSKMAARNSSALVGGAFGIFTSCTTETAKVLMGEDLLDSGLINRFMLVPEERVVVVDILNQDWTREFTYPRAAFARLGTPTEGRRSRVVDTAHDEDRLRLSSLALGLSEKLAKNFPLSKQLTKRVITQAVQIASLIAIYESCAAGMAEIPHIRGENYDFAFELVKRDLERFLNLGVLSHSERKKSPSEAALRHIQAVFEKSGSKNVSQRDFTRHTPNMISGEIALAKLTELVNSGQVTRVKNGRAFLYTAEIDIADLA